MSLGTNKVYLYWLIIKSLLTYVSNKQTVCSAFDADKVLILFLLQFDGAFELYRVTKNDWYHV